jgi:Ca2+-binding EF-hand superfamily protein
LFITIEVFILLPVVVAVLLENFAIAERRFREQEERKKLQEGVKENMYTLDPLLETLMSHTSEQHLTSKLLFLFQKFDVDDDKIIDFQEIYEGLHKLSFTPPIKLTFEEYEHIAKEHETIDFRAFSSIMREQLKSYCQRRLGELISSVQNDNQQEVHKQTHTHIHIRHRHTHTHTHTHTYTYAIDTHTHTRTHTHVQRPWNSSPPSC